ncbi:hypothetical protein EYF80_020240 [Liparis tanakae]|uniref:Uncharacterized protein n=1 Tax=Liparis tanakae TaxID=230148 RepID=A0A4Z2HWA4_9TELE|nr:hypothetical protein EYF80_020240 [Liparis tanakae]
MKAPAPAPRGHRSSGPGPGGNRSNETFPPRNEDGRNRRLEVKFLDVLQENLTQRDVLQENLTQRDVLQENLTHRDVLQENLTHRDVLQKNRDAMFPEGGKCSCTRRARDGAGFPLYRERASRYREQLSVNRAARSGHTELSLPVPGLKKRTPRSRCVLPLTRSGASPRTAAASD